MRGRSLRPDAEAVRRQALKELSARERLLLPGYKLWGYKNHFAKGFLVTDGDTDYIPREGWERLSLGPWRVQVDPLLPHQLVEQGEVGVLVLGYAFDDRGPQGREHVPAHLLRVLTRHPEPAAGRRALDEVIAWLSGRYLVLVRRGAELDVYGDPMATRTCYWHKGSQGVALASHTGVLAELAGGLPSTRMDWVLGHPDYKSPFGRWLPGLITPHDGVGQVYANGRLTIRGSEVRHERFFPLSARSEMSPGQASEGFLAELRQQVSNWISVAPLTVLALTAGRDSRAVLEAGLVQLQQAGAMALTYHPFHIPGKSTYADLATANRRAASAQIPHLVLDVSPTRLNKQMRGLYTRTFPTWQRYANLASALYLAAPARAATMFGVGGGIITGMIRDRSDPEISPELLARKYAYSRFSEDPGLHAVFEAWLEHTDFSVGSLKGYNFYDFFHWEHRMSKWGASGYSEYDLATIPAPVLNSRRLLTTALSLPEPAREANVLYRYISEGGSVDF
ncbi:hypothetical protein [Ornithinimicrobium cavernae]|uniref:hypothetical protein n=1 Tax=Ornithinimicrobium cavernae TaxID=2666047 RepID=UPI000D69DD79|nr:hypothetical protein [Ornithinimicrobium cavernae]